MNLLSGTAAARRKFEISQKELINEKKGIKLEQKKRKGLTKRKKNLFINLIQRYTQTHTDT